MKLPEGLGVSMAALRKKPISSGAKPFEDAILSFQLRGLLRACQLAIGSKAKRYWKAAKVDGKQRKCGFDGLFVGPVLSRMEGSSLSRLPIGAAAVLLLQVCTNAHAQNFTPLSTEEWDFSPFQSTSVEMAIATNKKTGHKMHVMRLKDGTMMAIVPAGPLSALMKESDRN